MSNNTKKKKKHFNICNMTPLDFSITFFVSSGFTLLCSTSRKKKKICWPHQPTTTFSHTPRHLFQPNGRLLTPLPVALLWDPFQHHHHGSQALQLLSAMEVLRGPQPEKTNRKTSQAVKGATRYMENHKKLGKFGEQKYLVESKDSKA